MIDDTISKIEERIRNAATIKPENKAELLNLLAALKSEVGNLSTTNEEHARSITGFTEVSTHEAFRETKSPELLELSLKGLSSSAEGLETSHPSLVQAVNAICVALANLGV